MTTEQSYREKIQSYNNKIRARNVEQIKEFIKNKVEEDDWTKPNNDRSPTTRND